MADAPQNSVTRDDLRDALAHSGPRRRPTGLLSARPEREPSAQPAWDWDTGTGVTEQHELIDLRDVTAEQRRHIADLVRAQELAAATERELREALSELAGAGVLRRRAVVATLRQRGLV
jgi:Spy/CpxP family protein refolding chaperone